MNLPFDALGCSASALQFSLVLYGETEGAMRSFRMLAGASLCVLLTSFAAAQELSPGKYSGSYNPSQFPNSTVTIVVDIQNVDNGAVTGQGEFHVTSQQGTRMRQGCVGGFPVKGTVKGDAVTLTAAEKWGPNGECKFFLRGTVSGDKISGKVGQNDIQLSK